MRLLIYVCIVIPLIIMMSKFLLYVNINTRNIIDKEIEKCCIDENLSFYTLFDISIAMGVSEGLCLIMLGVLLDIGEIKIIPSLLFVIAGLLILISTFKSKRVVIHVIRTQRKIKYNFIIITNSVGAIALAYINYLFIFK